MIAMSSSIRTFVIGLAALLAAACAPRAASVSPIPDSWAADTAEIRAATQASADAWNRGDLKAHLAFYVDTVTFMTATGPRPGVAAVEKAFSEKYFRDGRPRQTLSFSQVTIRPLGRDAALETGRFLLSGGGEPEQSGWFTLVWMRTADGWRAVHDHSS